MCTLHEEQNKFLIIPRSVLLRMRNVSDKVVEKLEYHILCSITSFVKIMFMRQCGKILQSWAGHRRQYGACPLHSGYLRVQTHT